ncbi:haloacid dehalogenase type II [Bradyrhizobium sp. Pha-3]|uniref:haloacid dehalogenase type II n=1 Tax=Bradyrhizobium sp. Pha-3 TaxID=208375 RepID=UPI0035D48AE5
MRLDRRTFTTLAAASVTAATVLPDRSRAAGRPPFRAVAFDGFPVIDPRPVSARLEEMFPGMGAELSAVWRTRQFEYGWLRTLGGQYADFWRVTEDALVFAAKAMKISLSPEQRDRAMQSYLELKAWPDVVPALVQLRAAGLRMAFLSNFTAPMLDAVIRNSGLEGLFEEHLSTDKVAAFKPDARAYQMGVDAFGLKKEEIVFAAFAGWDVAGAKWFGYPTFWVNRSNASAEELGVTPDGAGAGLHDLVAFATAR